jgi:predicted ATPase/Tfp pilus assembly protein PilF
MRPSPNLSVAAQPDHAPPAFPAAPPRSPAGSLVGRDACLADLVETLGDTSVRIVTLAGPGGSGKSRLAREAARCVERQLDGRVAWIQLAAIESREQVLSEVASGIGLADVPSEKLGTELSTTLGAAPALVVLDDAEHVIDGVRDVADVLAGVPGLHVLVTTTTSLSRPDEFVLAVDPLALPADDVDPRSLADEPAIRLLLDRAAAAGATIPMTPANAAALARIVRRLDGLPLAIELAGAMLRLLAPYQLLDRLDARVELTAPDRARAGGPVDDRHRSLRATMDWSYDLLAPEVQTLYRRLGVFSGTFGMGQLRSYLDRSVEHGLRAPGIAPEEGIAALVSASLLRVRAADAEADAADGAERATKEEVRYELLGIVRDDAARRLAERGEATAANWAHANDLLSLAEWRHADLVTQPRPEALADFDAVHEDLLAVLERARADHNAPFVVRLAGAMSEYWRVRGRITEGRLWLDAALRMGPAEDSAHRARALHGAGVLDSIQGDFERARERLEEAFRLRVRLDLAGDAASSINQLGLIALEQGDLEEGERLCREALDMRRDAGDLAAVAGSLNSLGGVLQFSGNFAEARAMFEEALAIRRGIGDEAGASVVLGNLGLSLRDAGELDDALRMLDQSIATRERLGDKQRLAVVHHNHALVLFDAGWLEAAREELEWSAATARELGDRLELSNALSDLGFVAAAAGDLDGASALQQEALTVAARIGAKSIVAQSVDGVAEVIAARGKPIEAARLWAAAETLRRTSRSALLAADRRRIDRTIEGARACTREDAWWSAWAAGESLELDEMIHLAQLSASGDDPAARAATEPAVAAV